MKVLVLIEAAVPSRYWEAAVPLLSEKGIDTSFATVKEKGELSEVLKSKDIPVYAFDAKSSLDYPKAAWKLADLVNEERFDIVHACESIPASISGVSSYRSKNSIRLFHRQHNACPQNTRVFHNIANKTSQFMMTCSDSTRRFAHEHDGFDLNRIKVAYNGIESLRPVTDDELDLKKQALKIPVDACTISIVARLRTEKGHRTLFRAAEVVSQSYAKPIHIVVTGGGYAEEELRAEAGEFDSFDVHFTGHQEDISPWFSIGDIVVMPSYSEPFGIVAIEAMSSGRPLIASGVDGLLEVVEDDVSGILVPPRDEDALAKSILRVLNDPDFSARLVNNARDRVQNKFSMENMVDSWIDCYHFVSGYKD